MEDRMDGAKTWRELETSSVSGDLLKNAIWTKAFVIEFLHRPFGLDIARVKPAKVIWFKEGNFLATVLSRRLVTVDRDLELVA